MAEEYKHNHLYPKFHINKWIGLNGKIYEKRLNKDNKIREINNKKDFVKDYYYSFGNKNDSTLEKKLGNIESSTADLINTIDQSTDSVALSQIDLELLKLYCLLCASRHEYTCEVIKSDESSVYRSNNYLIGILNIKNQKDVINISNMIIDEFTRINNIKEGFMNKENEEQNNFYFAPSHLTFGLHVSILKSDKPNIIISDRLCIIENTMDSCYLYTYIPIAPRTVVLMVNSKYYLDESHLNNSKQSFGLTFGNGTPDEYLSDLFGCEAGDYEKLLLCSYKDQICFNKKNIQNNIVDLKINKVPIEIIRLFNSIYCEDGEKILFCDEEELHFALKHQLQCRDIYIK